MYYPKKKIERPEGAMVYYSMDNLRGRLGSTRKTKRGLGCNTDSSTTLAAVIEGNRWDIQPLSDMSRSSTFGGGETRMQMRKLVDLWGDQ